MNWTAMRMVVSVGNYKMAKKSGYTKWARVMVHVSPVSPSGAVITALDQTVEFWPSDQSVDGLLAICEGKGEEISIKDRSYKRYLLKGDAIPEEYRDMFSFMGELVWEYVKFDQTMVKVRLSPEGRPELIRDENGKPIVKDGFTLAYWRGDSITSGLQLSRESRLAKAMRDWLPISSAPSDNPPTEQKEEDKTDADEEA